MDYNRIYNSIRDYIDYRGENHLITISESSHIRPITTFYLLCTKLENQKIVMLVDDNNLSKMFPLTNVIKNYEDFEHKCKEILESWGYSYLIHPGGQETSITVKKIGVIL